MLFRHGSLNLGLVVALLGCGCSPSAPPHSPALRPAARIAAAESTTIDKAIPPDPQVSALIRPYQQQMKAAMDERIGEAAATFERGKPESALGNLVVDALLAFARSDIDPEAEVALMNNGGIRRLALPAGPITVGDIYQMLPFDNRVVVVVLSGTQLEKLISALAKDDGELLAGCTYRFDREHGVAGDILVGEVPIVPEKRYRLATVDYLASIGGKFAVLQEGERRGESSVYIRDALIAYIRERQSITPVLDGRVSYESEE